MFKITHVKCPLRNKREKKSMLLLQSRSVKDCNGLVPYFYFCDKPASYLLMHSVIMKAPPVPSLGQAHDWHIVNPKAMG